MNPKKIKKVSIILAGAVCAMLIASLAINPKGGTSVFIGLSDFKEIAPGIYLEPGASQDDERQFFVLYEEAKARIANTYGEYTAQPVMIVGHSDKMTRYGNGFGTTHYFPWKQYVVIGANGHNIDVMSHELMHAELFQRVGYWKRMTQIPAWFDEGSAMQVDYRKPFDLANFSGKALPDKDKLWWTYQFTSGGDDALRFHYAASKEMVRAWKTSQKQNRFYEILNEIKNGKGFDEAFTESKIKS